MREHLEGHAQKSILTSSLELALEAYANQSAGW
jgi:hypothetical protein